MDVADELTKLFETLKKEMINGSDSEVILTNLQNELLETLRIKKNCTNCKDIKDVKDVVINPDKITINKIERDLVELKGLEKLKTEKKHTINYLSDIISK